MFSLVLVIVFVMVSIMGGMVKMLKTRVYFGDLAFLMVFNSPPPWRYPLMKVFVMISAMPLFGRGCR